MTQPSGGSLAHPDAGRSLQILQAEPEFAELTELEQLDALRCLCQIGTIREDTMVPLAIFFILRDMRDKSPRR